jgi:(p)ppGpp synthase/HD superfamily hydrolase
MTVVGVHDWSAGLFSELSPEGRIEQASRAQTIAVIAHRGQVDKSGHDYISHPRDVARRFDPIEDTLECCAAWLHDVLEDTDVTADDLELAGIHDEVIEVVKLLTRRKGVEDSYYCAIAENPAARAVKIADITNNTDPCRMELLDSTTRARLESKYRHALEMLNEPWPDHFMTGQVGWFEFGSPRLWESDE